MYQFKKLSDWLPVQYVEHEDCPEDMRAVFEFDDDIYHLSDFVKVHDCDWIDDTNYPDYIHCIEMGPIDDPYFIELDDSGENVRVYMITEYSNTKEENIINE